MAEERNRVYIESVSDFLLSPTLLSKVFLEYEGIIDRVFVTGNLIVNVCRKYVKREGVSIPELQDLNLKKHLLLTLHRPETVGRPDLLKRLMNILSAVEYDIIFPCTPNHKE